MDKVEISKINKAKITDKHGTWSIEYTDDGIITFGTSPSCHIDSIENLLIGIKASRRAEVNNKY